MKRTGWFMRPFEYADWIARFDALSGKDVRAIRAHITRFRGHPRFHLLVMADEAGAEAVVTTLDSVRAQLYRNFTCTVLDSDGALEAGAVPVAEPKDADPETRVVARHLVAGWLTAFNASLAAERAGDWVMLLRAGDTLPAHALYWHACEILPRPAATIVYSDDDTVDTQGRRCDPRFKPDWSPSHLRSTNYVGEAAFLRGSAVAAAGGVSLACCRHGNFDLLLRAVDAGAGEVVHVPAVLFHRRGVALTHPHPSPPLEGEGEYGRRANSDALAGCPLDGESARAESAWHTGAVREHLERNGSAAAVEDTLPGCRRVRYRLPETPPLVSIIVPTRDAHALIRTCVESLMQKTSYARFEVLVVDNQSADPAVLAYFNELAARPAVRVLRYDRPFNYSAINNFAAREARGEMLCLLNNDTEVISPDWLEEMAGHLVQPGVGVVGAKLLFPDGRVQHAGDAVGPRGCADHMHFRIDRSAPGYCGRAALAHEVSAVTGACLLTWKHLYEQCGGLNERSLAVAFNDVDYCLRVQEAGERVIFTAHAELFHHQSATRGSDASLRRWLRTRSEVKYLRRSWRERLRHDPYYNPNLSYREPDFSLNRRPRVSKPWRKDRNAR